MNLRCDSQKSDLVVIYGDLVRKKRFTCHLFLSAPEMIVSFGHASGNTKDNRNIHAGNL